MGRSISKLYTNTITVKNKLLICSLSSIGVYPDWCHPHPPTFETLAVYKSSYRIKRIIGEFERGTLKVPIKALAEAMIDHEVEIPDYIQYTMMSAETHLAKPDIESLDAIYKIFEGCIEV